MANLIMEVFGGKIFYFFFLKIFLGISFIRERVAYFYKIIFCRERGV